MAGVEESIEIHAPIDEVFAIVTDPRRGPDWNNNILEVANVSATPVDPGTTWEQTVMMAGRRARLKCRVVDFRPPHGGMVEVSGDQRGRLWTECRPTGKGTLVIQGMDFVPPGGVLGRIGIRMAEGMIRRELARTLERQRSVVENELRRDYGPGTRR